MCIRDRDLVLLSQRLTDQPVHNAAGWLAGRHMETQLRFEQPLIESDSIDCVVSNCVLNLVRQQDRHQLFAEIFRVLKKGGRAVISDIVRPWPENSSLRKDVSTIAETTLRGCFRGD